MGLSVLASCSSLLSCFLPILPLSSPLEEGRGESGEGRCSHVYREPFLRVDLVPAFFLSSLLLPVVVLFLECAPCVDAVGDDAPASSSYVGSCLLLDAALGWCCVLCDLLNATNATAEGGVNRGCVDSDSRRTPSATGGAVLAPRDTYRRRVNAEPLELEVSCVDRPRRVGRRRLRRAATHAHF